MPALVLLLGQEPLLAAARGQARQPVVALVLLLGRECQPVAALVLALGFPLGWYYQRHLPLEGFAQGCDRGDPIPPRRRT